MEEINRQAGDDRVRLAMLLGSWLESSWSNTAVGDNGTSFGPFQIHLPAHPGVTRAQAQDPASAVRYMLQSYQGGVSKVPAALWQSDPKRAASLAAFYAERPAHMYDSGRVDLGWRAATSGRQPSLLARATTDGKRLLGKGAGAVADVTLGPLESYAESKVQPVKSWLAKAGVVVLGGGIVLVGAFQLFRPQVRAGQDRAAELGGIAVKGA